MYRRKVTRDWWIDEKDSFDLYIKEHIEAVNRKLKLFIPEIITPLQLFKETGDENER